MSGTAPDKLVTAGEDTIAAFSTAIGGPIVIIRVSGERAGVVLASSWRGREELTALPHRALRLGRIVGCDGDIDSSCLGVFMPSPHSYTGEDMVELHCHGGALGARLALQRVLQCGARHAEPGEFTKRAFLNGKMDLTQAEAVADIIGAHSSAALRVANHQLEGALGGRLLSLYEELTFLLSELEARLDFPDEDLDWLPPAELEERFERASACVSALLASRREGEILRHGIELVIAGPPNVGKSSLMNAILGRDRAIVTDIPGTTRDTLEELAHVRGIPIRLVDTAGIREARDVVERSGIERSYASMKRAAVVLWVIDASQPYRGQEWSGDANAAVLLVGNKCDVMQSEPTALPPELPDPVYTCALTGQGLDSLYDAVERLVWETPHTREPDVAVSARHAALLDEASVQLADARSRVGDESWELASVTLRGALAAVGRVTGRTVDPDLLDVIFSRFCVGK